MDPLSISASIMGLTKAISTTAAIIRWLVSVTNAPFELAEVQNELETVQGYLSIIRQLLQPLGESSTPILASSLDYTASIVNVLEHDVKGLFSVVGYRRYPISSDGDGLSRVQKLRWRHNRDKIYAYRDKIRHRRVELSHAVALIQPAQSLTAASLLLRIEEINAAGFASLGSLIEESTRRVLSLINDTGTKKSDFGESLHENPSLISYEKTQWPEFPELHARRECVDAYSNSQPPAYDMRPRKKRGKFVQVRTALRGRCPINCSCQCHSYRRINSPQVTAKMFGQLFLNYTSIPVWNPRCCNHPRCLSSESVSIHLTYLFPGWLIGKALHISSSYGCMTGQGASLHLSVSRVLPTDHGVWWALDQDRLPLMQKMVASGEILPTDVDERGNSLLFLSILSDAKEVAEYLIPYIRDVSNATNATRVSPVMLCWQNIHTSRRLDEPMRQVWETVLDVCEYDNANTLVIDAIFGEVSITLEEALERTPGDVNKVARDGGMPLHWAVRLSDSSAVRLLIDWKADINAKDPRDQTPLMIAAKKELPDLVDLLIDAGADINLVNSIGESPLYAAVQVRATRAVQSLLRSGARPVRRSRDGEAELHSLVPFRDGIVDAHIVDLLVDAGFNLNELSYRKWSPAMNTLRFDDPVGLRVFLARGADLSMTDADGRSVLHLAALYSSHDVMRILKGKLSAVDLNLVDTDGKTAMDYWRERCTARRAATEGDELVSQDDLDAFEALIESMCEIAHDDLEGEDVFYDTVEFHGTEAK